MKYSDFCKDSFLRENLSVSEITSLADFVKKEKLKNDFVAIPASDRKEAIDIAVSNACYGIDSIVTYASSSMEDHNAIISYTKGDKPHLIEGHFLVLSGFKKTASLRWTNSTEKESVKASLTRLPY